MQNDNSCKKGYAADNDLPDDELEVCAYCGGLFHSDYDGHVDEETGLAFCDAPCEMHYHAEIGLPPGYELANGEVI